MLKPNSGDKRDFQTSNSAKEREMRDKSGPTSGWWIGGASQAMNRPRNQLHQIGMEHKQEIPRTEATTDSSGLAELNDHWHRDGIATCNTIEMSEDSGTTRCGHCCCRPNPTQGMVEHDPNAKQYILDVSEHGGYPQNCYLIKTIMINHILVGVGHLILRQSHTMSYIYIYIEPLGGLW